jgi:hypothetical protein
MRQPGLPDDSIQYFGSTFYAGKKVGHLRADANFSSRANAEVVIFPFRGKTLYMLYLPWCEAVE